MTLKERDRLATFSWVRDGQMTLTEASGRLGLGYRQAKRLWRRYRQVGMRVWCMVCVAGRGNNRRASDGRGARALELYRDHYGGFGPTLAAEQMAARDGLAVDHETLRRWLIAGGLWKPRRDKRRRHPRKRAPPTPGAGPPAAGRPGGVAGPDRWPGAAKP